MDAQKTGAFIADRRKEIGLTQACLAEKLHVTDKAVSKWERGAGLPDINIIEALADALEVSIVELIQARHSENENISIKDAERILTDTIHLSRRGKAQRIVGGAVIAVFAAASILLLGVLISAYSTVIFSVGSLITGLIAWAVPIWQMTLARREKPMIAGVTSFGFALTSVVIQFLDIANEAHAGDWSAIEDTIDVLWMVAVLFCAVTLLLNIIMAMRSARKRADKQN